MRGTHSLPDAHPHHRHSRERQTSGQLSLTIAVHNRGVGFSCDYQMVSLFKRLLDFVRVWKLLAPGLLLRPLERHGDHTPVP